MLPIPFDDPATYPGHSGVDFGQPTGTPVPASGPGRIFSRGYNDRAGNYVWVTWDGDTPDTLYAHLVNGDGPSAGTRVSEGTTIGYVGSTGNSTGPHLHVEVEGYATTAGFWQWFTATRVVGDGSAADGGLDAQAFLDSLGYDTGAPGWGPKCGAATFDFQGKVGLTQDSDFGPDTTAVAEIISAGRNATSRATREIQTALKAAGFDPGPIDDGWGNKTSFAEYRWQRSVGLDADAIHGPNSDTRLFPPTPAVQGRNATDRPTKDVQARLGVPQTGVWDRATSDAVYSFQGVQGIDQDRIWGPASDGLGFPPAGSLHGVDFSFARIPAATLTARGVRFVARYLWRSTYDDGRTNKGLSTSELAQYRAAGIDVALIYEEDGKELLGGRSAGIRVAQAAELYRTKLGLGAQPIYFNVDFDVAPGDIPSVLAALDGIASVIGIDRVGLYGGYSVIKAAFDAGRIRWGFQTYAWSGGKWDPRAQLQQWSNGQWGDSVDFTRAVALEYGQHPVTAPGPDPGPDPKPEQPDLTGLAKLIQQLIDLLKKIFGGAK